MKKILYILLLTSFYVHSQETKSLSNDMKTLIEAIKGLVSATEEEVNQTLNGLTYEQINQIHDLIKEDYGNEDIDGTHLKEVKDEVMSTGAKKLIEKREEWRNKRGLMAGYND